jgi:hypothetical protein
MADYPIPPWLAPVSPVAPFLQGVSQGSSIAEAQNRQALALAQMQQQEQQDAFRNAQAAISMQLQMAANRRAQDLQGQQLFGLRLANQQKANDMAATMQAQGTFQRLVGSGVPPADAWKQAAGFAPFSQQARFYQAQAVNQNIQNRADRAAALRVGLDPEAATTADIATATAEKNKPVAQKNALAASKLLATGDPEDIQKAQLILQGKGAIEAPAQIVKSVATDYPVVRQLFSSMKAIEDYDAKYGKGAFQGEVGPMDSKVRLFSSKYSESNDPKHVEATQLLSSINTVIQAFRLGNFGTALSAGEKAEFAKQLAADDSNAFVPTLRSFSGTLADRVKSLTKDYDYDARLEAAKKSLEGYEVGDWNKAQKPTGLTPRKTADGRTALFDPSTKKFVRYAQ